MVGRFLCGSDVQIGGIGSELVALCYHSCECLKSELLAELCGHARQVLECASKLIGENFKYEGYLSDYSG